jgi:hypothetical protein
VIIAFHILKDGVEYIEKGENYRDEINKPKAVDRLVKRLHRLGFYVTLEPVPADLLPVQSPPRYVVPASSEPHTYLHAPSDKVAEVSPPLANASGGVRANVRSGGFHVALDECQPYFSGDSEPDRASKSLTDRAVPEAVFRRTGHFLASLGRRSARTASHKTGPMRVRDSQQSKDGGKQRWILVAGGSQQTRWA